jgi:hypothetical protein
MQAERNGYAIAEDMPKANQGHEANRLLSVSQAGLSGAWAK